MHRDPRARRIVGAAARALLALAGVLAALPAGSAAAASAGARLVAITAPPPEHRADPALRTYVYRFGPHRIGPYSVVRGKDAVAPPPVAGAVVAMDTRLVTRTGAEVPQHEVMLHHIVYTNGGRDGARRDGACPGRPVTERFFGTSEERRALTLPSGYGYPSAPRDRWRASWMVMNHQASDRAALIEYRVTVDPRPGMVAVVPYWLSVLPCSEGRDPQYSVPGGGRPGASHARSRVWRLPRGGRIVAVGGHLHGGARGLTLSRPDCGERPVVESRPTYAPPGDPLYAITPLLHEPDPASISWTQSATGWSAPAGSRLRVRARYDAERPHMRVMGIAHVYVARVPAGRDRCGAAPADAVELGAGAGRSEPPAVSLTLAAIGPGGQARPIDRPAGPVRRARGNVRVRVAHYAFSRPNLSIPRGSRITWRFAGSTPHDATLAAGPVGFASPSASGGRTWSRRFATPGEYRVYCSLHPVYMSQYVRVR